MSAIANITSHISRAVYLQEEEDYAKFLIYEFENGLSKGVEHGTTLRAYLSKRLVCAPMRITKKFSGKKVGTMVFVQKLVPQHLHDSYMEKNAELEKRFVAAILIETSKVSICLVVLYLNVSCFLTSFQLIERTKGCHGEAKEK
jgi:hypothetical protein